MKETAVAGAKIAGWLVLVGAIAWFNWLSPEARECGKRGGSYYPLSGECGSFIFEKH